MIIRGTLRRPRVVPALRGLLVATAVVGVLCALAFAAGAAAYRQGELHLLRDRVRGWMQPTTRVKAILHAPEAPVLALHLNFEDLARLRAKREEALSLGVLLTDDGDRVPAILETAGTAMPVRVRLKGDAVDHLRGKRWSLRVELDGNGRLWGMRRFSVQHPGTRGFEREWLFHRHLAEEGVLGLRYHFARLLVNGDDVGLVAVEEHFSKELLEAQARREGPIVKFDERGLWERHALRQGRDLLAGTHEIADLDTFQSGRTEASETLGPQADTAVHLLRSFTHGERTASEVFNVPKLARYFAMCELYGSWHAMAWHNVRFYYDPVEARLEPIGFDVNSNLATTTRDLAALRMPWVRQALEDPALARAYAGEVERLTRPEHLAILRERWSETLEPIVLLLNREWPIAEGAVWRSLERRAETVRAAFSVGRLARGSAEVRDDAALGRVLEIELYNSLRLPLEVIGITVDGEMTGAGADPALIPAAGAEAPPAPWRTRVTAARPDDGPVVVRARIAGWKDAREIELRRHRVRPGPDDARPPAPTAGALLSAHRFLERDGTDLRVRPGTWTVRGDLRLPPGVALAAGPGTVLRFEPGALLLAQGPLQLTGTEEAPVRLEASEKTWAGVLVRGGDTSTWQHVVVTDTAALDRRGWTTTGGVTFYRSPARLESCRFERAHGEDALNVFGAPVELIGCVFLDAASDAFDGDFVTGRVADCRFERVAGDGVDVSGSELSVTACSMRDIGDKAISAGEQSVLSFEDVQVVRARFAVVSKDSSRVTGCALDVRETILALAAYVKKPEYGPAEIDVLGVRDDGVSRLAIAQTGCRLRIGDRVITAEPVDVDALYADAGSS